MSKHASLVLVVILHPLAAIPIQAQPPMEHVVVETNAGLYEPEVGQVLQAGTDLQLASGEFLVLIAENGDTIRIDGPFSGPAPNDDPSEINLLQAVARLIGRSPERLAGPGGFRGPGGDDGASVQDLRPSPWLIHAELSGPQCYVRGQETVFWRNVPSAAATFQIVDVASERAATIRWASDENRAVWPSELPPIEGAVYTLRQTDRLTSGTTIQVFSLEPGAMGSSQAAAAWLAARGCTDQARLALAAPSN
jgi:hypothetical protein